MAGGDNENYTHHDARGAKAGYIRTAWAKGLRERVVVIRARTEETR